MKKFVTLFMCITFICTFAVGCKNSDEKVNDENITTEDDNSESNNIDTNLLDANTLILGNWKATETQEKWGYYLNEMEFYEDGTIISGNDSGTYKIEGNHLCIYNMGADVVYTYSITTDTLTLRYNSKPVEYKRQYTGDEVFLENTTITKKDIKLPSKMSIEDYPDDYFNNYVEMKEDYFSIMLPENWKKDTVNSFSTTNDYGTKIVKSYYYNDHGTYIYFFYYNVSPSDNEFMEIINKSASTRLNDIENDDKYELLNHGNLSINGNKGNFIVYRYFDKNNKSGIYLYYYLIKNNEFYGFSYFPRESLFNMNKDEIISILSTFKLQ